MSIMLPRSTTDGNENNDGFTYRSVKVFGYVSSFNRFITVSRKSTERRTDARLTAVR